MLTCHFRCWNIYSKKKEKEHYSTPMVFEVHKSLDMCSWLITSRLLTMNLVLNRYSLLYYREQVQPTSRVWVDSKPYINIILNPTKILILWYRWEFETMVAALLRSCSSTNHHLSNELELITPYSIQYCGLFDSFIRFPCIKNAPCRHRICSKCWRRGLAVEAKEIKRKLTLI